MPVRGGGKECGGAPNGAWISFWGDGNVNLDHGDGTTVNILPISDLYT